MIGQKENLSRQSSLILEKWITDSLTHSQIKSITEDSPSITLVLKMSSPIRRKHYENKNENQDRI